jgi:translation initiation factor IF-3
MSFWTNSSTQNNQNNQKSRNTKQQRKVFKNDEIKAFKVLVVTQEWEKVGIFPRDRALAMAAEQWMDLVQIWYNPEEKIATAKIVDFWKYMYEKKKWDSEKKKQQKQKWQKEMKFGYNIWDNDLALKIKKSKEFLGEWYTVKMMVVLRWREKIYKDIVRTKLEFAEQELVNDAKSHWIKDELFGFSLVLLPKK